uniref:RRM domain-containing protein n=1 Tax=Oncorhynchus kisutch TaxID=8019 RepID=A0A8C7FKV5_ONCKI
MFRYNIVLNICFVHPRLSILHNALSMSADEDLIKSGNTMTLRGRVIYVGHLPTGLFEPQLKSYIEQFGNVVRLQLLATTRHTPSEVKEMTGRLLHKEAKLRKRLAEKGIHYDFPGFVSVAFDSKDLYIFFLDRRRSMKINDEDGEIIKNTPAQKKSKGKCKEKGGYLVRLYN